jgi:periplasmic protein TonB
MSYVLSNPATTRRGGLLGIVIGLHAGLFALFMTAKAVLPQIAELPLMVDFIEAMPLPVTKPAPTVAPQPIRQKVAATLPLKSPQPVLETTTSSEPAPNNAPIVSATEAKPSPAVAGGSTANSGNADAPLIQARFDADYLRNPAPAYPPMSRRLGEEGKVILRVRVSAEGAAEHVEIKTSSGSTRLDDSAQHTVRTWKFIPAKRGAAVESWVLVPILFRLEQ